MNEIDYLTQRSTALHSFYTRQYHRHSFRHYDDTTIRGNCCLSSFVQAKKKKNTESQTPFWLFTSTVQ